MDKSRINSRVENLSEKLLLHYSSPNQSLIAEILLFDATRLDEVPDNDLTKYIFAIGQYLVMLQHHENLKSIAYMLAYKQFTQAVDKEIFLCSEELKAAKITTIKGQTSYVISNNQRIQDLEEEMIIAEAEKMLLDGMVKASEQLLNALKKARFGKDI